MQFSPSIIPNVCSPVAHFFWERGGFIAAMVSIGVGLSAPTTLTKTIWSGVRNFSLRPVRVRTIIWTSILILIALVAALCFAWGTARGNFQRVEVSPSHDVGDVILVELVALVIFSFIAWIVLEVFKAVQRPTGARESRQNESIEIPEDQVPERVQLELAGLRLEKSIGYFSLAVAAVGAATECLDWALELHSCEVSPFDPLAVALTATAVGLVIFSSRLLASRRHSQIVQSDD